jgi:Alpha/beta hydrolase domain
MAAAKLTQVNVPGTTALGAAAVDLKAAGYTEREFYADGTANRYRGATPGSMETATVIDGNWPYRTRVLVRAPKPDHFNGTLIVEWTNVTIGVDANFVFAEAHADLLREGYAYATVSVQKVGVDRDKSWSPQRYGTLSVDASNVDPQGGGTIDATDDPLSWDIYTQVAEALKANVGPNPPLPGLRVRNVIATGQSQSAARLTTYYNTIQPLDNFFNGFVFWDRATSKLRPDVAVPGISVNSEALSPLFPPFGTSKYTREWEVAGTTHGSIYAEQYVDAMFNRDKSLIGPNGQPESFTQWVEPSCSVLPAFSTVPTGLVIGAAMESVRDWITTGRAAAPSIYFDRDANGALIRDSDGNVEGGVRLSQFVAPTAAVDAFNGTAFPCSVSGSHRYYTAQELKARYHTHGQYVAQVAAAVLTAVKDGYELPHDAAVAVKDAATSSVAR